MRRQLLASPTKVRLGWTRTSVTKILAYYNTKLLTIVKSLIVLTPGLTCDQKFIICEQQIAHVNTASSAGTDLRELKLWSEELIWWIIGFLRGHPNGLKPSPRNTNSMGRLSTVDLPIKVTCFEKNVCNIFNMNRTWYKLLSTRRSTVLSLPFQ